LVARGEVRWLELEAEGRRPVVVPTPDDALPSPRTVVVALVTRAIDGVETEVELGPADGIPVACAVSLDNV
jgi:mRNA-degrading endonuclease toxin of MazEF toxin-antitoxin module